MDINLLNARLVELQSHRKQLEIQIIQLDGHIKEVQFLIHELVKNESTKVDQKQMNKDDLDLEMQCL